jgi:hypothetical protein
VLCAGQVYESSLTVKNQTGPPSSVTLAITKPDGTPVTPAPTLDAGSQVGDDWVVTYGYTLPAAGLYGFTWVTQGPGTAPPTDWVNVTDYRSIVSFADAAAYLGVTSPAMTAPLQACLAAATQHVERIIGTCVPQTFTGQWVDGQTKNIIQLPHGPLLSATSVTSVASVYAGGPSWAAADMVINPEAATCRLVSLLPFWYGPWKATYTAGRTVIPGDVQEATKLITWDLWATRRWETPDAEEPDLATASAYENIGGGYEVHGRALALLDGERRPGFG